MNLPKINTLRTKELKLNGKNITIKPWTNLQLTNFDSIYQTSEEFKFNLIKKYLLDDNIECKVPLTLLEERFILTELFKLSKSNILDIVFTCESCEAKSGFAIQLDKVIQFTGVKQRTIKTKDCIFNLSANSTYRMNLDNSTVDESLRYVASFIESFDFKDKTYEVSDLEEMFIWLRDELDKTNFDSLITQFNEVQPKIEIDSDGTCEFCGHKQKLNFKGIEDFLE